MKQVKKLIEGLEEKLLKTSEEKKEEAKQIEDNECLTGIADIKKKITDLEEKIDGPGEGQEGENVNVGGGRRRRRRRRSKKRARKNSKRGNISKKR